jgi:squalene-hopene/tetraprenyl-beta-curcumene cyclase
MRRFPHLFGGLALFGLMIFTQAQAEAKVGAEEKEVQALIDKAIEFLKSKQEADGSFFPKAGPGVTALVASGLIRNGRGDDPVVKKALEYLEKKVQKDGGIYDKGLANYTTCVAVVAFKEANKDGKYDKVLENAGKFLKTLQVDDTKSESFGGVGYDGKGRPDLSNTQYFIDALIDAGVSRDDPALKNAIAFVSRCQNLPNEANQAEWAKKVSDDDKGGFIYNPLAAKDSKSLTPEGGLRSTGGLGYAGLKSLLYAGVAKDDPRVKAAVDYIRRHYTVEENPGQGTSGLYYYYHTFAKAMDAFGEDEFADSKGKKHDWRKELFETLKKKQSADGSWSNSNRTFMENQPELATAFALLSLSYTREKK